jgi:protein-S-isoprenylcysteine O-methyltransferase Ste14
MNWKLKVGNFLFKYRSFTPVPFILLVFIVFMPMDSTGEDMYFNIIGFLISIFGQFIRSVAVGYAFYGTSGREKYLRAEALNVEGIYSIVRNPLYIGNFFLFSGLLVVFSNPFALILIGSFLFLQYYFIIHAEENYLKNKYSDQYLSYINTVPKIIPRFSLFKKPQNKFNLKKVIFKENDSVFNMLMMFNIMLFYKKKIFYGSVPHLYFYIAFGAILILLYIFLKIIKKRSLS